jgi:seryl-tRNA synthetase
MGAEATAIIELTKSGFQMYFYWATTAVALMLLWEIIATVRFVGARRSADRIEKKMETEGVSEKRAEEEVEEEDKTRKKDKSVFNLEVQEYADLKELQKEVQDAAVGKDLLDKASRKIRAMKKEERIESRLDKRVKALETEAKRLAAEEPKHKARIEELLLEIDKNHKQLVALMSENGEFETVLNTAVNASMTKEQKKDRLLGILDIAIKLDLNIIEASKQLGALTK